MVVICSQRKMITIFQASEISYVWFSRIPKTSFWETYYYHFSNRPREVNLLLKVTEQASGKSEPRHLWLQCFLPDWELSEWLYSLKVLHHHFWPQKLMTPPMLPGTGIGQHGSMVWGNNVGNWGIQRPRFNSQLYSVILGNRHNPFKTQFPQQ